MSLAAQYGLNVDMNIGNSRNNEQTTEQEYQAYVTAPCSPGDTDILKFWEASGDLEWTLTSLTRSCRSTDLLFPPSSRWQWIIF
jgi:hypothetical protein